METASCQIYAATLKKNLNMASQFNIGINKVVRNPQKNPAITCLGV